MKDITQQAISHFKYGISHDIFSEPVTTYAKLAVEALEQKWIPVTERLPSEPLQTVIVTNGKETCVAVYSVVYDEFGVMCGKGKAFGVTHWMPLPKAPKEDA